MGRACGTYSLEEEAIPSRNLKRQLGRRRHRWVDNTKMNFKKWDGRARIGFMWMRTGASGWML